MAFARYYFQRLSLTTPPTSNVLKIKAEGAWTWAIIRGSYVASGAQNLQRIDPKSISISGSPNLITLTVVVEAGKDTLAKSEYELVVGSSPDLPSDAQFKKGGQPQVDGVGITFIPSDGFHVGSGKAVTLDPPPPPYDNWDFSPVVNV